MQKTIIKWLICPIFIGSIPILLRLIMSLHAETIERVNTLDLIAFGLVLNIHNITQTLYINNTEKLWSNLKIIFSSLLIAVYGGYFFAYLTNETETGQSHISDLRVACYILNITSLFIGIIICYRISKKNDIMI